MGEQAGWTIRVSARPIAGSWSAIVEVWPPGLHTRTHSALIIPFTRTLISESEATAAGMAAARRYIDDHGQPQDGGDR